MIAQRGSWRAPLLPRARRARSPAPPTPPPFPLAHGRSLDMTNRDKFVTRLSTFRTRYKEFCLR